MRCPCRLAEEHASTEHNHRGEAKPQDFSDRPISFPIRSLSGDELDMPGKYYGMASTNHAAQVRIKSRRRVLFCLELDAEGPLLL